jgi:putative Holliday junction resolvase
VLCFDFGQRRIGVAVGQDVTGSASPLGVIDNRDSGVDHTAIAALVDEWQPTGLVVGLPLHSDGTPSDITERVLGFVEELRQYHLPVDTVDERYTSIDAERALKAARASGAGRRVSKQRIDSAAAVFIAERYLASE